MLIARSFSVLDFLFKPVDNSPLIIFRIIFGLLIFLESAGAIFTGWVKRVFIDPSFTFTVIGFEWLQPLPGSGMYYYYGVMAICGIMVMLGFYYRIGLGLFTVLWTITYLMQKTSYNNHYYLLILICLIMLLLPAHKYFSLDVKRNRVSESLACPQWCYIIVILQLAIVYTFAGLAKLYPDWLDGLPIKLWFNAKSNYPVIGGLLQKEWLQCMVVYGGIFYDLLIVPLLLWKRTRLFAFFVSVFFHLFNSIVFQIGIFPYLMIGMTIFFFNPERIRSIFFKSKPALQTVDLKTYSHSPNRLVLAILIFYFLIQIYLPLRHLHFPGNVHWTEEGHRLAWQMMLRSKSGYIKYEVRNAENGEKWLVNPRDYLSPKQARKLAAHPDMIWQFSQYLEDHFHKSGIDDIDIFAHAMVSLNGRPYQPIVDSSVNLAAIKWQPFEHAEWILPLE